eukprot:8296294-Pyramimonas_sp.AAC.1
MRALCRVVSPKRRRARGGCVLERELQREVGGSQEADAERAEWIKQDKADANEDSQRLRLTAEPRTQISGPRSRKIPVGPVRPSHRTSVVPP